MAMTRQRQSNESGNISMIKQLKILNNRSTRINRKIWESPLLLLFLHLHRLRAEEVNSGRPCWGKENFSNTLAPADQDCKFSFLKYMGRDDLFITLFITMSSRTMSLSSSSTASLSEEDISFTTMGSLVQKIHQYQLLQLAVEWILHKFKMQVQFTMMAWPGWGRKQKCQVVIGLLGLRHQELEG